VVPSVQAAVRGTVGSEALGASGLGNFDDAAAGTGKPVTGQVTLANGSNGGLAANYLLRDGTVRATADVTPRPISIASASAADKVYDGNTTASVSASLGGLVAGEALQVSASGRFADAHAGTGKAVTGSVTLASSATGLITNYHLADATLATTASIQPRGISFDATVDNKVYDGLTLASVSAWRLQGLLGADQVQVAGGQARFDDAQTGRAKPVLASVSGLAGADAANYRLDSLQLRTQADIAPATLTYVADPAVRRLGQPIDDLRGSVSGFVGGETLASSTRGQLRFVPRQGGVERSGLHAVDGGGLSAANYRFQQAPANDTALLVLPPDPPTQPGTAAVTPPVRQRLEAERNLTDLVGAMNGDGRQQVHFGALDVMGKSPSSLAAILDARGRYKKLVLAEAQRRLESDPDLADAPPCLTLEQADTGRCLVGEVVLAQVAQATGRPVASAATPVAPATTVTPAGAAAAPAGPPTAPAAASAAPATPSLQQQVASGSGPIDLSGERAPAAGLPRPSAASAVLQELLKAPPVRAAALPQIQRKLAVVIGIDNYADKQIPSLDGARRDAEGVANVLSTALGYETALVLDGSREAILRRLNRLVLQAGPEDSVVIYYAGHGDVVDKTKQGYWIPANARIDDPRTWISNNDIGRVIGRIPSRQVALISDSCFSGSLVGGPGIAAAAVTADPLALLRRRAAVVMTSGGNEPVADTGKDGHSVFTYNLMRSLQGLDSWRPGNNVFASVSAAVARALPQRPRYAAVMMGRHEAGTDYLFELRQLAPLPP
jgi:Caspase domain/YDG domain